MTVKKSEMMLSAGSRLEVFAFVLKEHGNILSTS